MRLPVATAMMKYKKLLAALLSVSLLASLTWFLRDPGAMEEVKIEYHQNVSCFLEYKAWKKGVITTIYPPVEKNCSKLLAGDKEESEKVKLATKGWKSRVSYNQLLKLSRNCSRLAESLTDNVYISKVEVSFPIAFSFVVYDSPEQFLRLLKVLYRPGNVYCIHPDKKSAYHKFFTNIAKCLHNVIMARKRVYVSWGATSLLRAQMHCLSDLDRYRKNQLEEERWQYVINLCGKEVPLLSVKEMVEKLIQMNHTSSVVGWPIPESEFWTTIRFKGKKLPYNLVYHKSMTYNALSEPFVSFLLHNSTAKKLYNFFMDTYFPEEHFYATLFRMPGAPGSYNPNISEEGYFEVGHYFWRTTEEELKLPCYGKKVHGICVVNFQDLPRIMVETQFGKTALFHNKYFMKLDHVIMDCMEERIVAKNKKEFELECSSSSQKPTNNKNSMQL